MISPIISAGSLALHALDQLTSARQIGWPGSGQAANTTGQTFPSGRGLPGPSAYQHTGSTNLVSPSVAALLNSLPSAGPADQAAAADARELAKGASNLSAWVAQLEREIAANPSATSSIDQRLSSLGTSALTTLSSTASVAATALSSGSSTAIATALDQLGAPLQGVTQALFAYRRQASV